MISRLTGVLDSKEDDSIILDVNGVGYLVYVPVSVLSEMEEGERVSLYIQTIVKEDAINLYGFRDNSGKKMFNLLISVQGVGAKIGLLMLSKIAINDLQRAIMLEDVNTLKSINGVGVKVAQRLITELREKVSRVGVVGDRDSVGGSGVKGGGNMGDALVVLEGLGYSRVEVNRVLVGVNERLGGGATTEEIIKECLKYIGEGINK